MCIYLYSIVILSVCAWLLRLAEYSLPAAPGTHTSLLFFETGSAFLPCLPISPSTTDKWQKDLFFTPPVCVQQESSSHQLSADCAGCYLSFSQWTEQCIYPAKLNCPGLLSKSSSVVLLCRIPREK